MEVFQGHRAVGSRTPAAVAIGNFDGVHLGHRQLLERARAGAAAIPGRSMVLTFDPHPAAVLAPEHAPALLSTPRRRLELIAAAGIDACVVERFDRALAAMSPEAFARDVLAAALGARIVVVGYDFTFGRNRAGTTDTLRELGGACGFAVDVVAPVSVDGAVVSSSAVRKLIAAGDLGGARRMLGRDVELEGVVVRGAGRGRQLGIPTANVAPDTELCPPLGIYAVWVEIDGVAARHPGAASVGTNPTFDASGRRSIEVHLLDVDRDLYGARVRVAFVEHLRDEQRFSDAAALVEQIHRDIADTRRVLARPAPDAGRDS